MKLDLNWLGMSEKNTREYKMFPSSFSTRLWGNGLHLCKAHLTLKSCKFLLSKDVGSFFLFLFFGKRELYPLYFNIFIEKIWYQQK